MDLTVPTIDHEEQKHPLYSKNAIVAGTFFGGPLVTGLLMRANFKNLDRKQEADRSLLIGILATVVIVVLSFLIPEKAGRSLNFLPILYTLGARSMVERYFEKDYSEYAKSHGPFYSGWRAFGITLIGLVIIVGALFTFIYTHDVIETKNYEAFIAEFSKNEEKGLKIYEIVQHGSNQEIITFIEKEGIPVWKRNEEIVNEMGKMSLNDYGIKQNVLLEKYVQARLNFLILLLKASKEHSTAYEKDLKESENETALLLEKLQKLANSQQ